MKKLKLLLLLIFSAFALHSQTQDFSHRGWGIKLKTTLTPASDITPVMANDRASITSGAVIGYEGGLFYIASVKPKLEIGGEIKLGTFPVQKRYNIDGDFSIESEEEYSDITFPERNYSSQYIAFGLFADYTFYNKRKIRLIAGGGLHLNYFTPITVRESLFSTDDNLGVVHVYDSQYQVNIDSKVFLSPELRLGIKRKLGNVVEVGFNLSFQYSNFEPVRNAEYTIFGIDTDAAGRFSKQFYYLGADLNVVKYFE